MKKCVFALAAFLTAVAGNLQALEPPQSDKFGEMLANCLASGVSVVDCGWLAGAAAESGKVDVKHEFDFSIGEPGHQATKTTVSRCTFYDSTEYCDIYECEEKDSQSVCTYVGTCFEDSTYSYCEI